MSDAEWALLEPHLPDRTPARGGRWADHRVVVDGIRWRTRTGVPWRDLPERFGCWQTVYGRHRRWCADGTWTRVLDHVRAEADRDPGALDGAGAWKVAVDSTVARASADAAGARHAPPKDVPAQLLEDLAAAVPAGARTTSKTSKASRTTGSPPTPAPCSDATSAPSPAARAEDQASTDAAASTGGGGGEAAGHGDVGDGDAEGELR